MYYIARLNDEGNWVAIDKFPTYEDADEALDMYADVYHNTVVDIIGAFNK